MSGGSLDYLFGKVEEHVGQIRRYGQEMKKANWIAFADHLENVAKALHDCEWVLSADMDKNGADAMIDVVLGKNGPKLSMKAISEEIKGWLDEAKLLAQQAGVEAKSSK